MTEHNAGRMANRPTHAETPPSDVTRPRSWRIEFPAQQDLLNANQRLHWSAKNRITQQIRSDAFVLAKYTKIPRLRRAKVVCFYEAPTQGRAAADDVHNLFPSAKAAVDGLVDAGVLESDRDKFLEGPDMRPGPRHPGGRLVLIITELSGPGEPA